MSTRISSRAGRVTLQASEAEVLVQAAAIVLQNRPKASGYLDAALEHLESSARKAGRALGISNDEWREMLRSISVAPTSLPNTESATAPATPPALVPSAPISDDNDSIPVGERIFSFGPTYQIIEHIGTGAKGIRCGRCKRTSWHREDVKERYCSSCNYFHSEMEHP